MADEWKKRLNDPGYKNWLKVSLALIESKEALHDFTENIVKGLHNNIAGRIGSGTCDGTCNTNKGPPSCPNCALWVTEIKKLSKVPPNWKNADPKIWHNTPWEFAKCFMNAQGNKATAAKNAGPAMTDLSGMLNVLANCKEFRVNHFKVGKAPETVRSVRNDLMHCATMSFNDVEMQSMINKVIALLEDDKELKHLQISKDKVKLIKSLRDEEFELKPKDEDLCIETALESHRLLVESGEEIDKTMKSLFDRLFNLIKDNNDLKKYVARIKMVEERLDDIEAATNTRFSVFDFKFGDLQGQVERLEENFKNISISQNTSTRSVIGSHENSLFKNALQIYAQKKKLALPLKYECTTNVSGKFVGTVVVDGKTFQSAEPKPSKKEAEQSAAEEALRTIGQGNSDDQDTKSEPSLSSEEPAIHGQSLQKLQKNYKNLLQERAQKEKIPYPIYDEQQSENGFLVNVLYDGTWFSPSMSPQPRKKDAEQKAAQFVLAFLDREAEGAVAAGAVAAEVASHSVVDTAPTKQELKISTTTTPSTSPSTVDKPGDKKYKSLLNEYAQKRGAKPPKYEEIPSETSNEFRSVVKVLDKTFQSAQASSSKRHAQEMAAMEAMKYFVGLSIEKSSESKNDFSEASVMSDILETGSEDASIHGSETIESENRFPKTGLPTATQGTKASSEKDSTYLGECVPDGPERTPPLKTQSDISASNEIGKSTQECSSEAKVPSGKTYKSLLNEYAQRIGVEPPKYEEIRSGIEFRSKVKIADKTFECATAYRNKKTSEEMAAKEAMNHFNTLSTDFEMPTKTPIQQQEALPNSKTHERNQPVLPDGSKNQHPSKVQTNFKNALQEHVKKRKPEQELIYRNSQDTTTKLFLSKVFVGKRCFKGKQFTAKVKEAEKHVAEIALDFLEGGSENADAGCKDKLKEYHEKLGFPSFPKYEKTTCNDDGNFRVEVKVVRKIEVSNEDGKEKKKDVEVSLAEQALVILEDEKKLIPALGNPKSRLNLFLQSHEGGFSTPKYDVRGDQGKFSGSLSFYVVDEYESLNAHSSKQDAIASAAMSACNAMDLI